MDCKASVTKVSVAERAAWLREMAESNRVKQQTLCAPNRQSAMISRSTGRSAKVSIKERVRMFESMTVAPAIAASIATLECTTSEHGICQHGDLEDPLKQPPPPQNNGSSASSDSSMNVVEIISSGDANTSTTTSLSSSSYDDPTSPKYGIPQMKQPGPLPLNNVVPSEPKPLLGLPVTSIMKPLSRMTLEPGAQQMKSSQHLTNETRTSKPTLQLLQWTEENDEPTPLVLSDTKEPEIQENELNDEGHIVKIVKIVNRSPSSSSPSPPQRPLLSLPWDDDSDDFSDPWTLSQSNLDFHARYGTDGTKNQSNIHQPLHRLPTTILNPSSLRSHRSQFKSSITKTQKSQAVVFMDDCIDDFSEEDEDDIQTVDNSVIFNFSHDANAATRTNTKNPFTTSLSFDSTFANPFVITNPESPIQPPPITRYTTSDINGTTNDISVVLKMNWIGVPDKVPEDKAQINIEEEEDTKTIDKKGLIGRIKSKTTKIPMLEMRKKRTTSLLCSSKQNHPLLCDEDIAIRSRTASLDSNNDTTGLWFSKTFDSVNVNDHDVAYFPSSPLDSTPFNPSIHLTDNPSMAASDTARKEKNDDQRSVHAKLGSSHDGISSALTDAKHQEATDACSFPAVASAILGNVFAEEIAAEVAAVSTLSRSTMIPTLHAVSRAPQTSSSVSNHGTSKSAFTSQTTRSTGMTTSTSKPPSVDDESNDPTPLKGIQRSIPKSTGTSIYPPKSDRISSTIAQLRQTSKNAKFQKTSLIQSRKDQLARNLERNRSSSTSRVSKGSWQKDSTGNFKRHFILVDDCYGATQGS